MQFYNRNCLTCSFINLDFLLPHKVHFDYKNDLASLVFKTLESTLCVFFLHCKQYVNMFYNLELI